jgi:L-asparaginase II
VIDAARTDPSVGPLDAGVVDGVVPVAAVTRGGVVESVHHGHLVALDGAERVLAAGDPDVVLLPRSCLKPLQAVAMLRAGLDLDGELLALACASHAGEPLHLDGVRRILAAAGLTEGDLRNTPAFPLGVTVGATWRAEGFPASSLAQNCSGKHAAMLATCVAQGWDTVSYLRPDHPLQRAVRATVADLVGAEPAHVVVDGCGAPAFSTSLSGLARAFARIAAGAPGTPEHRVAAAMSGHPEWVGGSDRPVTAIMAAVPGLVAKDGAEGVFAAALPDGRALAVKVLDGSHRPVPVLVHAALAALGAATTELVAVAATPVLGHGTPVGEVLALVSGTSRAAGC